MDLKPKFFNGLLPVLTLMSEYKPYLFYLHIPEICKYNGTTLMWAVTCFCGTNERNKIATEVKVNSLYCEGVELLFIFFPLRISVMVWCLIAAIVNVFYKNHQSFFFLDEQDKNKRNGKILLFTEKKKVCV